MRLFFATIVMATAAASAARASSFVAPEEITAPVSPSIVVLGGPSPEAAVARAPRIEPETQRAGASPSIERFGGPPPQFVAVSASVIAMVDAPQPVTFENVAAIGDEDAKRRVRNELPMVIRGGIVGGAFTRTQPVIDREQAPRPQQEVSAPPPGGAGPERREPPERPGNDGPAAPPALPPAAPPTGRME